MATRIDDVTLMAYVDGELDAATARDVERAIGADPALANRARVFRESASLLRGAYADALHEKTPDRLVAALTPPARTAKIARIGSQWPFRQVAGMAMAASLAALIIGAGGTYWYVTTRTDTEERIQQASAERWLDHVAGFYDVYDGTRKQENRLLIDFKADDIPQLTKWFGARLNRNLSVPDLSAMGFHPQGGRLLIINGRPAAQLLYTSDGGEVVGLVIAFTTNDYQPVRTVRRHNVNIVHWRHGGYAYAFVGSIDPQRLRQLAEKASHDLDRI